MKWDRVAHMNAGRERALERRNNGGGGRVVARTTGGPAIGTIERLQSESRARWDFAIGDFLDGLRFDLFGDQWGGL